jgi:hypothetical protein
LLLFISNENDEEIEKINDKIGEMEAKIEGYKAALAVVNQGNLEICALYWKNYCI